MQGLRRISGAACFALAFFALSPLTGTAAAQEAAQPPQTEPSLPPTLSEMRARDRFGVPAEELAAWEAYLASLPESTPPAMRAEALLGRAIARFYAKDHAAGYADVEAARALAETLPKFLPFEPELLSYGTLLLLDLDRADEARELAAEALTLAEGQVEMGVAAGPANLALAHNVHGSLAFAANDLPEAERRFCLARDLSLDALPPADAMIVTNASTCGVIKYFLERPDTMEAMQFASDHAATHLPPDHPRVGAILNNSYGILVRLGRYSEAAPLIRRHLALERSLHANTNGGAVDDVFDPLAMLAKVQAERGRLEEAQALAGAAADMAAAMDTATQPYKPGVALVEQARYLALSGQLDEAEAVMRRAVDRLVADLEPGDTNLAHGWISLADILEQQGQPGAALALADRALANQRAKLPEDHSEITAARLIRARILAGLGRADEALPEANEASAIFETSLFALTASEAERVSLSRVAPAAFGNQLQVALAAGDVDTALRAAQLHLVSELAVLNARIGANTAARGAGLSALVDAVSDAESAVAGLERQFREAQAEASDAAELTVQLADARESERAAREELEQRFPDYVDLLRPELPDLARLQAALADDELAVFPVLLTDRAVTLLVANDEVSVAQTLVVGAEIQQLAARVRADMQAVGAIDDAASAALYRTLFPPQMDELLARKTQLLFPASGYLSRISPGALLTRPLDESAEGLAGAPWLARSHAVHIVSDFGQLGSARQTHSADSSGFLGVGAPVLGDVPARAGTSDVRAGLPPLPEALAELAALRDAVAGDDPASASLLLTQAEATEAALFSRDISQFKTIAFATHGLVSGEIPGLAEPALVMSADGAGTGDGLLTASEISRLRLSAELVILSACNTGSGSDNSAPAFSGLARAFRSAGAGAMMLSHWRVRDDAAARLSVATVTGTARGFSRAEALRRAQLAMIADDALEDGAHPAIWAPFVLIEN